MKKLILLLALFFTACTTTMPQRSTSSVVQQDGSYLDTREFPNEVQSALLKATAGQLPLSATQTLELLNRYEESSAYQALQEQYTERLFSVMNIDASQPDAWRAQNPALYKGIINYVGSSDESMADEPGPDWQKINRKLRSGQPLSKADRKFLDEILFATKHIPQVKGLVFRGHKLSSAAFKKLQLGEVWLQKAFTSTSISYQVAYGFGASHQPDQRGGILIINTKGGTPVSPLTFDNGFQGQPGRIGEREVLLAPGAELVVTHKIEDAANNMFYVFAEER